MLSEETMADVSFEEIAAFVALARHCRKERVTLDTRLAADLGLDGDEAEEFFEAFRKQFAVDLSALEWDRHFGPEAAFMPWLLLWPPWWKGQKQKIEIRVSDLLAAARAGCWILIYEKKA
jgi:hypothetical protein